MILQQILVTPDLPFKLSHALPTATTTKAPHGDEEAVAVTLGRASTGGKLTPEQKYELLKSFIGINFDKEWMSDKKNEDVLNWWISRGPVGRYVRYPPQPLI
jgi:hypothetical protein